jgi:hypothetical protein
MTAALRAFTTARAMASVRMMMVIEAGEVRVRVRMVVMIARVVRMRSVGVLV